MLVLSRKLSQQILIGSDISLTIVKIDRNQVRIGIEAPESVTILREELAAGRPHKGLALTAAAQARAEPSCGSH